MLIITSISLRAEERRTVTIDTPSEYSIEARVAAQVVRRVMRDGPESKIYGALRSH